MSRLFANQQTSKDSYISIKTSTRGEIAHLVIDSTGLKVLGEGEWKVQQHGVDKQMGIIHGKSSIFNNYKYSYYLFSEDFLTFIFALLWDECLYP